MEPIMKVINALSALTAALQEMTEQTTDNYLNTFETIYDPEKDKPVAEEKPTPQTVDSYSSASVSRKSLVQDIPRKSKNCSSNMGQKNLVNSMKVTMRQFWQKRRLYYESCTFVSIKQ